MSTDSATVSSLFSLSGKVAFISGAGGHLGAAMSTALALAGARVFLNGRNLERLDAVKDRITSGGGKADVAAFDLTDAPAMEAALRRIEDEAGRLDVIVNNAYSGRTGSLQSAEEADYAGAYRMAVTAPAMLLKTATPLLERSSSPHSMASVINVASMYGWVSPDPSIYGDSGHNSPPHYGAAKGALLQFTRYAAVHLAARNIRVNAISPGAFPKPKVQDSMPELWSRLNDKQPLKRVGRPEEIQGAILFLASNASSYVTGANIPVDGGWTAW